MRDVRSQSVEILCDGGGQRRKSLAAAFTGLPWRLLLGTALPCLLLFILAGPGFAQAGKDGASNQEEEKFKGVDPYTKGDPETLQKAGYKSLAPFSFAQGISAEEMHEVLGGIEVLWAETAHFKICSSLKTYKSKSDSPENEALDKDLALLAKRIPGFRPLKRNQQDPWLRLHLYALRLEMLYEEFCARTGFRDADFPPLGTTNTMGSGPYLGQKLKPTILLAEKRSALGRFNLRYAKSEESGSHRAQLEGGSIFFGISAESMREAGFELDIAMHCAIVAGVTANMLDGLRDSYWATPLWFDMGLGHWFSRRVDKRFTYYANGTSRYTDDDLSEWQPRVRGLVDNKFPYSWQDMLETLDWKQLTPQAHMLMWSRVDWMLQQEGKTLRAFMEPISVPLTQSSPEERNKAQVERATKGLSDCFGQSVADLDRTWATWVLKTYARK